MDATRSRNRGARTFIPQNFFASRRALIHSKRKEEFALQFTAAWINREQAPINQRGDSSASRTITAMRSPLVPGEERLNLLFMFTAAVNLRIQ
jgi:hypothetical protein